MKWPILWTSFVSVIILAAWSRYKWMQTILYKAKSEAVLVIWIKYPLDKASNEKPGDTGQDDFSSCDPKLPITIYRESSYTWVCWKAILKVVGGEIRLPHGVQGADIRQYIVMPSPHGGYYPVNGQNRGIDEEIYESR